MKAKDEPKQHPSAPAREAKHERDDDRDAPDVSEEFDRGTGLSDPVENREWSEEKGNP